VELLELGVVSTVHDLLAGGPTEGGPPVGTPSGPGMIFGTPEAGHGFAIGSVGASPSPAVMSRPSEQVNELLAIIAELLPDLPRDGIYAVQVCGRIDDACQQVPRKVLNPHDRSAAFPRSLA